jgi:hypothetical protein
MAEQQVVAPPPAPHVPRDLAAAAAPVMPLDLPVASRPLAFDTLAPVPITPLAPVAPLEAAPVPAPVPVPAVEKKAALDPRYRLLPVAIFGGFAVVGLIETAIVFFTR